MSSGLNVSLQNNDSQPKGQFPTQQQHNQRRKEIYKLITQNLWLIVAIPLSDTLRRTRCMRLAGLQSWTIT
jgi:hypothetical protein